MAPAAVRREHSTRPLGQWWVRPSWRPSAEQLAEARAWLREGRPVPMHWYALLGEARRVA